MEERVQVIEDATTKAVCLQQGVVAILNSLPHSDELLTTTGLERRMGLHRKLAWQVFRLATSRDALAAVCDKPPKKSFERFLASARAEGASDDIVQDVQGRFESLDDWVVDIAGTWEAFESLASTGSTELRSRVEEKSKEALRDAASHLWGVCAGTRFAINAIAPSTMIEGRLDIAHFDGFCELHRRRGVNEWPITEFSLRDGKEESIPIAKTRLFDEGAYDKYRTNIVPSLCSLPMPSFRTAPARGGKDTQVVAQFRGPGHRFSESLVFGYSAHDNEAGPNCRCSVGLAIPSNHLMLDVIIHKDLPYKIPTLDILAMDASNSAIDIMQNQTTILDVHETVDQLGSGIARFAVSSVPMYKDIAAMITDRLQANDDDFVVYRTMITNPMLSTITAMTLSP